MLSENLKNFRKAKGLSQEELAVKLNVVRQTVSKWEQGLSVPDSEMLLTIAAELDTSVSVLLGETVVSEEAYDLKTIAAKLEILNGQFTKKAESSRKTWRAVFVAMGALAVLMLAVCAMEFFRAMHAVAANDAAIAIIGGADGPTAVFVAGISVRYGPAAVALAALTVAIIGICKTKQRP